MTLFIGIILLFVIEIILDVTWNRFYYKYGLCIHEKVYDVRTSSFVFPASEQLNEKFSEKLSIAALSKMPSLVFKNLSKNEMAFRERAFEASFVRYTAIIHAYLKYDPIKGKLTLKCFSNFGVSILLIVGVTALLIDLGPGLLEFNFSQIYFIEFSSLLLILLIILSIPACIAAYQISRFKKTVEYILGE